MPRNSSGVFTLLNAAFVPGTTISSSAVNGDLSDIATALSQSLATTGVSTMTGQVKAASGAVGSPGYAFASATATGFYLAGANQIGWAANGVLGATFNSDTTVTWVGAQSFAGLTASGAVTFNGAVTNASTTTLTGAVTLNATTYTFGAGAAAGFYTGLAPAASVGQIFDGNLAVVATGQKGQIYIPFPMTITKWWVMADQAGSITVDVLRANNAVPSVSIVGAGTAPNLTASQFTSAAPSGWTSTTLAANDFIAFNVTAATTVQRVSIFLSGLRTG